jgi:hypothetical protein
MRRSSLVLSAGLLLLPLADAAAQNAAAKAKPCEPTMSNPCRPPALGSTVGGSSLAVPQPREPARLNDSAIQDLQFDRNTSFGVGHGGILGLERKFDPKD